MSGGFHNLQLLMTFSFLSYCDMQGRTSTSQVDVEGPAWAPLRDNYMLTNSKLKDWDKFPV